MLKEVGIWVGEIYSLVSPRRMLIGMAMESPVGEERVMIKNVLVMDLIQQQDQKTGAVSNAWDFTPDPAFHSESPSLVNTSMFVISKFLNEQDDDGIINQYKAMVDKIRTARSGLIIPKAGLR